MLSSLTVKNFAIISSIEVDFEKDFGVITGETGSGKSIIIDAISLLAGQRSDTKQIKNGANKALVQGLFTVSSDNSNVLQWLTDNEYINDDDPQSILITRSINANGHGSVKINGILASVKELKELGKLLIDIQGQNGFIDFLNSDNHLPMLDSFADKEESEVFDKYAAEFKNYVQLRKQQKTLEEEYRKNLQEEDLLKVQSKELADRDLTSDNLNYLIEKDNLNNKTASITSAIETAEQILFNQPENVSELLLDVSSRIAEFKDLNNDFKNLHQNIDSIVFTMEEVQANLNKISVSLNTDDELAVEIKAELDDLQKLLSKYGPTMDDVAKFKVAVDDKLNQLATANLDDSKLKKEIDQSKAVLAELAKQLTEIRTKNAKIIENSVNATFKDLYMENSFFKIDITHSGTLNKRGGDTVNFLVKTNSGNEYQPLVAIASGGELSRILLALKSIFAKKKNVGTIIFDEIDTGVSGRVAKSFGNKMAEISEETQVISITHLPQVAATAKSHYTVQKDQTDENTYTTITKLTKKERISEIAQMMSGTEISEIALKNAEELLNN